jgi:hypothetical protein
MNKRVIPISLAALLACAGCAVRMGTKPAETTPTGVPRSAAPIVPKPPAAPDGPVAATGSTNSPVASVPEAPALADAGAPTAARKAAESQAPSATASIHVFSAQQAVSTRPSTMPPAGGASLDSPTPAAPEPETRASASGEATPGELQLRVVASASEIAAGGIMTVDVIASSSTAVVDAPLHLTFDPNVVEFVDGSTGDFLTQGGSSVVFLADGRSRPGDVAIATGRIEREQGARGAGLLCRVRFRGVASGTTPVLVGQAKAWGIRGEELTVLGGGTSVAVN